MEIRFLSPLLVLAILICHAFPTTASTALDSDNTDVANPNPTNDGVEKSSGNFWGWLPNPSDMIGGIQDLTASVWAVESPDPSTSSLDIWDKTTKKSLTELASRLLEETSQRYESISTQLTDITSAMNDLVNASNQFGEKIQGALSSRQVTLDMFTKELGTIFAETAKDLQTLPSSDDAHDGHATREIILDKILDDTSLALNNLALRYGFEQEDVSTFMSAVERPARRLIEAVADIKEGYPYLFYILLFCIVILLFFQSWIFSVLLYALGFGPLGIIKGSIAALLQSYFWGGAVASGSWFALLQAAGMGAATSASWSALLQAAGLTATAVGGLFWTSWSALLQAAGMGAAASASWSALLQAAGVTAAAVGGLFGTAMGVFAR